MVTVDIKSVPNAAKNKELEVKNDVCHEKWSSKTEFLLSCIGLSVGIGNVWRFPFKAYQNGGGAFLVAYTIVLFLVGKPHYFAELALGQFTGLGAVKVWKCFPVARGVGYAMITISVMVAIYYNVIMSYTLYFMGQSMRSEVPWQSCQKWWGADDKCYIRKENQISCWDVERYLASIGCSNRNTSIGSNDISFYFEGEEYFVPNDTYYQIYNNCSNGTETASEQFWEKYVLELTSGIEEIGGLKWDLTLTLFVCWMLCFLGLMNGIRVSGKIVYFTATFPYFILVTLVIYGCTLKGAGAGLKYFFIPQWSKLLEIEVWRAAVEQLLFSLSLGWGSLIMYASYNNFDNKLQRDALIVSILDFATSLMAGIVIFAVLGNLSYEMKIDISKVAKQGQGLAFVTYPEALARLPVPQLWSAMFFFMLFLLAIDSEFSYLENVFTAIYDAFPNLKERKRLVSFTLCMIFFLLGLPNVTQGGQYILNLMDQYAGGYAGVFIATAEIIVLMWGYGAERFSNDLEFMLGSRPGVYWRICWKYISPVVLLFVLIYSLSTHKVIEYDGHPYPMWAERLGWVLIMVSVAQIPVVAVYELYKHRNNIMAAFRPHPSWGPSDPEIFRRYQEKFPPIDEKSVDGIDNIAMENTTDDSR